MMSLTEKIINKHKGSFARISYQVEVKPSAVNSSRTIKKVVTTTVRIGVAYSHIKSVKERQSESAGVTRAPWWKWVDGLRNVMKENLKDPSKKYYTFATARNAHTHVDYFVDGKKATVEEVKALTVPSYWNQKTVEVFDVKAENLLWVA